MVSLSLLVALSLAAPPRHAPPAPPAPAPAPTVDGISAFERLKKLEGAWKTDAKEGAQYVALRLVANGTAVLETTTSADRTTVTSATIYAFEGTELVATNYGSGGTSHLRLKELDATTLRFESASREMRVAALAIVTKEPKLRLELTIREGGRETKKPVELLREYVDTLK